MSAIIRLKTSPQLWIFNVLQVSYVISILKLFQQLYFFFLRIIQLTCFRYGGFDLGISVTSLNAVDQDESISLILLTNSVKDCLY